MAPTTAVTAASTAKMIGHPVPEVAALVPVPVRAVVLASVGLASAVGIGLASGRSVSAKPTPARAC